MVLQHNDRFAGQVAVVTGGAAGIGLAIASRYIAEGGSVVLGDINADAAAAAADELGPNALAMGCNVIVEDDVAALNAAAVERFGRLDAAFNVAGGNRGALLTELTEADWDFTIDLCLKGVFFGIKHAARQMIATNSATPAADTDSTDDIWAGAASGTGGVIVNIASLNSRVPSFFAGAYAAAKAGVASLSQTGALELAEHGIRVATVSPGLTDTQLVGPMLSIPGVVDDFRNQIPLGRPADPKEIAAAALFLASEDGSYVSGSNLFVDGGWEQTAYPNVKRHIDRATARD